MDQKVALFQELKDLLKKPNLVLDLTKTSVAVLQEAVNQKKKQLGILISPVALAPGPAPPAPALAPPAPRRNRHFGFAPEAFSQTFDPENASHFNEQTGKGGAANAGKQVPIRSINGGVKDKRLSYSERQKLATLNPNTNYSKRRLEEDILIFKGGRAFRKKYWGNKGNQANKNGGIEAARNLLTAEVSKLITEGKIILEENETQESIINNLLEEVIVDQELLLLEKEKLDKGNKNVLKGGLNKLTYWGRKSKFNELFTKKFGHGPTNHVVNGIINQHNVHAGVQPKGGRTRKNRKNKH
jgi:hypothetical protein